MLVVLLSICIMQILGISMLKLIEKSREESKSAREQEESSQNQEDKDE